MLTATANGGGRSIVGRVRDARRGVAGLEFALVAPVMALLVIGTYDISKAVILDQEVYNAARDIPLSASIVAVQVDKSTSLTVAQVQQQLSGIFADIPWLRSGIESGQHSVTMTSVIFLQTNASCNPKTTTCAYAPNVAWSVPYADPAGRYPGNANTFQAVVRPCGVLNQVAPTAGTPSDLTSLRTASVVNPDPILVVDVHYRYTPIFLKFVTGPIDFWASGYWPVRSVVPGSSPSTQYTRYDIANQNAGVGKCPGFS